MVVFNASATIVQSLTTDYARCRRAIGECMHVIPCAIGVYLYPCIIMESIGVYKSFYVCEHLTPKICFVLSGISSYYSEFH